MITLRYSLAIIMGFYVVGLVLLLMVMQILALAFPYRWYLKLFWFEGASADRHTARESPPLRQTSEACMHL
jgi:hypothetical protein